MEAGEARSGRRGGKGAGFGRGGFLSRGGKRKKGICLYQRQAYFFRGRGTEAEKADGLVFSPGPGWPADAGKMEALIKDFAGKKPMMGICLGHQAIAETFGGKLGLAKNVMHGKQSNITFETPSPIFKDIDNDVPIMRYHSIVVDQMPEDFDVTAITTDDQEIMAIQHKELPIYGLQYHPESIGSPDGLKMVENFVKIVAG